MDFMAAAVRTSPAVEAKTTAEIMTVAARGPVMMPPTVGWVVRRDVWLAKGLARRSRRRW